MRPSRPWASRGICFTGGMDPDIWHDEPQRPQALHICHTHCPVLIECEADALMNPIPGSVYGGIAWKEQVHTEPAASQRQGRKCVLCVYDSMKIDRESSTLVSDERSLARGSARR